MSRNEESLLGEMVYHYHYGPHFRWITLRYLVKSLSHLLFWWIPGESEWGEFPKVVPGEMDSPGTQMKFTNLKKRGRVHHVHMHVYILVNPFHLVLRQNSPIKKKEVGFIHVIDQWLIMCMHVPWLWLMCDSFVDRLIYKIVLLGVNFVDWHVHLKLAGLSWEHQHL
jgi:hypothetical protein